MTQPARMFALVDAKGAVASFGTEVASEEVLRGRGLTAVPVDQLPDDNHDWDPAVRRVRALTEAEKDQRNPRRALEREVEARRARAKGNGASTNDKLDYLIALLEARGIT